MSRSTRRDLGQATVTRKGASTPSARLPPGVALRVFLPFACAYFLSYSFRTINSIIAPNLAGDIGLSAADLGLLTSTFFLAFALAQLPLGMLLDRFGPRRVEAGLLLFAAGGAAIFAAGDSLGTLTLGRALIGFGVSACMMAGFTAFVMWFPPGRLPLTNALMLACGALGALAATAPVEWALDFTGWRGLFIALSIASLLAACSIFLVAPERAPQPTNTGLARQLRGLGEIFRDRFFWRIAPLTTVSQATFLAVQGLWAGPWLRDVAGLGRETLALYLSAMAAAIVAGFIVFGALTERLARRGVAPVQVAGGGMALFMLVTIWLAAGPGGLALPAWLMFGFFGTAGTLSYAVLSQTFPSALAGRVNTGLNVLVFAGAFALQWGIGAVLQVWEDPVTHTYAPQGYRWALGITALLQFAGLIAFMTAGKSMKPRTLRGISE